MDSREEKRKMAAQSASLSRIGTRILNGLRLVCKWILPPADDLGYTADGAPITVNVAWDNEYYMGDMNEDEKIFFRMGVFAHETLHQVFTNFRYSNKICNSLSQAEAAIFMKFANTLEDPAIEYFAPNVMGGKLLAALKYSIAIIYKKSPGIEGSRDAFTQMLNALIHFGDCGIVKGNFTFPEAEEYFKKVAPIYNEGITCADSKRRLNIAKQCMEITRPLWEEYIKDMEEWEKLVKELMDFLQKHGVPQVDESELEGDDGAKSDARAEMVSKIKSGSKSKSEKKSKGSKSTSDEEEDDSSSGSGENDDSDGEEETDDGKGSGDGKDEDDSSEGDESSSGEPNDSADEDGSDADDSSDNSSSQSGSPSEAQSKASGNPPKEPLDADDILEEDLMIDDSMMDNIKKELEAEEAELTKAELKEEKSGATKDDLPEFDIDSAYFKHASVLNKRVKNASGQMMSEYQSYVSKYNWEIKILTKALQKIFSSDKEETVRATSGSYNIKRGAIGCSARIMDKRRDPANRKDAAVCLAIDLSGSMMCGDRIGQARKAGIVLAETLRNLNIPYYIMGFRADRGAQAVHEHFVTWNGKGRETLISMQAGSNNFDGYSIRYASNLLKGRPESNKLLFIISDGEPACMTYHSREVGNADTLLAVKEARKTCKTFGIAIGNGCSPETLHGFYGKDFIHCEDEALLTNTLAKKLVKMFK